jgi:hypothetical protein
MTREHALTALLRWYLERLDPAPVRITAREIGLDGAPAWTREFSRWLAGEQAIRMETSEGHCEHTFRQEGELCGRCSVFNEYGEPMAETGRYRITRRLYVFPMRAAVARLKKAQVPEGLPPLSTLLFALAATGSPRTAVDSLLPDYPGLVDPERAHAHLDLALRRVKDAYSPEPRHFPRRSRSDAQLNAEAVG